MERNRRAFHIRSLGLALASLLISAAAFAVTTQQEQQPKSDATPKQQQQVPATAPVAQVNTLFGIDVFPGHGKTKAGVAGVNIVSVVPGGPAAKAGMKSGDVITQVNGQGVDCPMTLLLTLMLSDATKPVVISADRAGVAQTLTFAPKTLALGTLALPPGVEVEIPSERQATPPPSVGKAVPDTPQGPSEADRRPLRDVHRQMV